MIKPYNGAKAAKFSNREPLPRGAYVLQIIDARVDTYDWGQKLVLAVDVHEGEYKGFFDRDFKNNTDPKRKWRGIYRISVPSEDSQYFASQQKSFNNLIACLEESNSGYHWDWDETKLKGKLLGGLWGNVEYSFENESKKTITGWKTECCFVTDIASIREGNFKLPEDKPLANKPAENNGIFAAVKNSGVETFESLDDDDLPF